MVTIIMANKWMLATAGSRLFGLFGVQRPPRQILVVRPEFETYTSKLDARNRKFPTKHMNEPKESQPAPNHHEPSAPVAPDYHERLLKIETDVAKILEIIEPPHLKEIARKEQEAETARKLSEAYASGELGHLSG
jgi:hypothetical protein